jgi:antitoxin component YwqK of YwqJK toxin-antitoxin module
LTIFLCAGFLIRASDPKVATAGLEARYGDSPLTGLVFDFYPNRRPSYLAFFWRGKRVGTERQWYPDGGLWSEEEYAGGLPNGEWRMWYPDGKVKRLAHYRDGERDGEMFGWHPNGQLSDYNFYERGREITHKAWISDGVPFYNYVYQDGRKVGMRGGDFCKLLKPPGT